LRVLAAVVLTCLVPTTGFAESLYPLRSTWSSDRSAIYTDVLVVHEDGRVEMRRELGGSVDGITMIQLPLYTRPPARAAFVPSRNSSDARMRWATSWVFITPDADGTPLIPGDGEFDALNAAVEAWNRAVSPCSYMRLVVNAREPIEIGFDGRNALKFRGDRWCRPPRGTDPEKCYDPEAAGITTLFFVDRASRPDNGMILDTDIEINMVDFAMAVGCETRCITDATSGRVEDLQNTLTHELGHAMGLDHTCWPGHLIDPPPRPLDHRGEPAPACRPISALPEWVIEATMYNYLDPMEIKKRTPEQDDIDGVCSSYPLDDDPRIYEEILVTGPGCCAVAGGPRRPGAGALALLCVAAIVGLAWRLRGRACSRSRRP
jgi:hypothetical protein